MRIEDLFREERGDDVFEPERQTRRVRASWENEEGAGEQEGGLIKYANHDGPGQLPAAAQGLQVGGPRGGVVAGKGNF